jgi:hypothetical protein
MRQGLWLSLGLLSLLLLPSAAQTDSPTLAPTDAPCTSCSTCPSDAVIAEGTTTIADNAFYQCSTIESVTFPSSLVSVGMFAFKDSTLTQVTMNDGLESIGMYAFAGTQLVSVEVPGNCSVIALSAFLGCTQLEQVILGEGVTTIGVNAFYGDMSLKNVSLPSTLTGILDYAFAYTGGDDSEIVIPGSCTSIGPYAFWHSTYSSVVLLDGILSIGNYAFSSSSVSYVQFPESLETLGTFAFCETELTAALLFENLTSVGVSALCSSVVDNVVVSAPTSVYELLLAANCSVSTPSPSSVPTLAPVCIDCSTCPSNAVIAEGTTSIADYAFYQCSTVESVTFPSSLVSVGMFAFKDSTLTQVTMNDGLESIGMYAFAGTQLVSVEVPGNCSVIALSAFLGCTQLEQVILGEGVTTIGVNAFYGDMSLKNVSLPSTLTGILDYAFAYTGGDDSEIVIPGSCTSIGPYAFWHSTYSSVVLLDGILSIGNYAFSSSSVSYVQFPESLETLGTFAFCETELTAALLFENLTSVGVSALCSSVVDNVVVSAPTSVYELLLAANCSVSTPSPSFVPTSSPTTACINCWTCPTDAVIAEGTTSIEEFAFYKCANVTSVTFPSSLISVGTYAFASSGVLEVTMNDGLQEIGEYAFHDTDITFVEIPGTVTTIEVGVFQDCPSLHHVIIGEGVITIEAGAFYGAVTMNNISLPSTLTSIGDYAFKNAGHWYASFPRVVIPSSCTAIGDYAFYGSTVTKLVLSEGVLTIGDYAFAESTLEEVTFPQSLTSIGRQAFCTTALTAVTLYENLTTAGYAVFCSTAGDVLVTAPLDVYDLLLSTGSFVYYPYPIVAPTRAPTNLPSLAPTTASAPTLVPTPKSGMMGFDYGKSATHESSDFECMVDNGFEFFLQRGYVTWNTSNHGTESSVDPNMCIHLRRARKAGLRIKGIFVQPRPKFGVSPSSMIVSLKRALLDHCREFADSPVYLSVLDNDYYKYGWKNSYVKNRNWIEDYLIECKKYFHSCGVLSSRSVWTTLFNDADYSKTAAFKGITLWYSADESKPNYKDFHGGDASFGSWTTPSMKQYTRRGELCNMVVGFDWHAPAS